MDDSFGVAFGAVAVPLGLQVLAYFLVIVDFAVEDNPQALVFIGDRLMTRLNINDAQPAHCQPNVLLHKESIVIWSTVGYLVVHGHQRVTADPLSSIGMEDTTDSAHN
jgi:hypothetical protein